MPTTSNLIGFALVALLIILIPGPSVLYAIGRALVLGTKAALISVLGNGVGVGIQILVVTLGLGVVIQNSPPLFFGIQLVGAGLVSYLGITSFLKRASVEQGDQPSAMRKRRVFSDSIIVGLTNAKTLVFFLAVLPNFVSPDAGNVIAQMAVLGVIFLVIGISSDSLYAIAAGKARDWLSQSNQRLSTFRGLGGIALTLLGLYMFYDALV